jgi:protein phosphatase
VLRFSYGAASHVGLVRETNEDAGFAGPYLQVVADGVGGAAAGEIASATAAYSASAVALGRLGHRPAPGWPPR